MHVVRKTILETLKETGGATVAELATKLDMAPISVRHHLDILQGDNLINVDRVKRKGSVGRPRQIYVLTTDANQYFPNNFSMLSEGLISQLKQILPPEQVTTAFQSMAHEIANDVVDDSLQSLPVESRIAKVVDFLNQSGYLARWEETPVADNDEESVENANQQDGFFLHKHNCPYAGISAEHPELCMMDQVLINELVGQPCRRLQSIANDKPCCTYYIHNGSGSDGLEHEASDRNHEDSVGLISNIELVS